MSSDAPQGATPAPRRGRKAKAAPAENPTPVDHELIRERLMRARVRLALSHPFLAAAVMRLPLRPASQQTWCATAATDGYHIFFNPEWIATLDDAALRGLLAHEVLHVLFAHSSRLGGRHALTWNWACDFAINALLIAQGFTLPKGGLISGEFEDEPAETIYRKLFDEASRGAAQRVTANGRLRATPRDGDSDDDLPPAGLADCNIPSAGADLLDPEDPRVRPLRADDAPDAEQVEALRGELRAEALSRLQGSSAQVFAVACDAADEAKVDWRALLRDRLTERIKGDWMSYPFSKRHLHRGLFMPSPGMLVPGHIVFAIDTSGSMTDMLIESIAGELRTFRETFPCRLTVIQADTAIRSLKEYDAMDGTEIEKRMTVYGRGGTDFRPVFAWLAEHAPDALVLYATDGLGSFPLQPPENAVIWLLTRGDSGKIPFGSVVKL
jgi:predicted metal-dependent peptidase